MSKYQIKLFNYKRKSSKQSNKCLTDFLLILLVQVENLKILAPEYSKITEKFG